MKKYVINTCWVLAEKIIRLSVVFLFFSLVSQKLTIYDFGMFSLSQTIMSLLIGVVSFGFDNVLIKEFSISKKTNEIFSTSIFFRFALSLLVISGFSVFLIYSEYQAIYKYVFIISSLSIIFQVQTIYYSYYQAISKSSVITKTSIIALLISSIIKISFIYYELGIFYYALSFFLDYLFSFLLIYIVSKKEGILLKIKFFDILILKNLLKQSFPIFISTLIVMIYTRIDQFMIAKMLGVEEVAKFNVAVRISDAYMFIPMAIAASFFPMVANNCDKKNIQQYFHVTHFFTFFSGAFVVCLTPWMISYFFGERYYDAIHVIYIIVIANVISSLGTVSSNILIIRNIAYLRVYRALYGLGINVILNIIFIPKYGIIGAAYSSLISQIVAAWISNLFSKKTRDCFYFQFFSIVTFGMPCLKGVFKTMKGEAGN
ncbi:flippase [Brenneria izbisi]|uniref:Flippase n=1 Tax=Brenneria izbisi TaxID=2939450 RepID=A0AA41XVR9_9GAMM|nr:flippase [Brenneria izbisi]MCV9878014.1 flippase [Brenneria izbisi]MCV9881422.1 flippase [Brenneria izbisi]